MTYTRSIFTDETVTANNNNLEPPDEFARAEPQRIYLAVHRVGHRCVEIDGSCGSGHVAVLVVARQFGKQIRVFVYVIVLGHVF